MEWFWQAAAGVMVAVVLWIVLSQRGKDYALILSIGACCLALLVMGRYLEPVLDFADHLQQVGNLQNEWLTILLKAVGIGLVVEIGGLICTDAGNAALGKTLQILGTVAILWLSLPLLTGLMELLEQVLGEV